MEAGLKLGEDVELTSVPTRYRKIIGGLQYLTLSRPGIAYSVNRLSQFMGSLKQIHWLAMRRLMRYLSRTQDRGIILRRSGNSNITCYCNADWAGDLKDCQSLSGHLVYVGYTLVSWCSKQQTTVSKSSTESEFRAISSAMEELDWVAALLSELCITVSKPYVTYCDNLGAIHLIANPVFHSKI